MTTKNENPYFDLTTSGIGYLNRARTVTPSQGNPYEAVSIAAFHGRSDNTKYTYFDCRVVGSDAIEFIKEHKDAINDRDSKLLVRFNVGDGTPNAYITKKGDNAGEQRLEIKGRLLKITWASLNQEIILSNDESNDQAPEVSEAVPESNYSEPVEGEVTNAEEAKDDQQQPSDDLESWKQSLGNVVSLDRNDPHFKNKRLYLRDQGYSWINDAKEWRKKIAA